jgi:enoyl-CoA hydratase/carnithine racemase
MTAGDAVHAGFADAFLPEADWPRVKAEMIRTGRADIPEQPAPPTDLRAAQAEIDACFQGDMHEIQKLVARSDHPILVAAAKAIARNSPLSMVATLRLIDMTHAQNTIRGALENELRFTARAVEQSDFLEGVRAQIIEKDRAPRWGTTLTDLDPKLVDALLAPLPAELAIRF